jgi:hypothetical protein
MNGASSVIRNGFTPAGITARHRWYPSAHHSGRSAAPEPVTIRDVVHRVPPGDDSPRRLCREGMLDVEAERAMRARDCISQRPDSDAA